MRLPTRAQSALWTPLTYALGTEARVRVLRILAATTHPVSIPALAREAGLNERGVRTVLRQLEELGVVTVVPGAGHQVVLRDRWPLAQALRALFADEAAHAAQVERALQKAATALEPPPIGVWLAAPHAAGTDRPTDPLVLVCYTTPKEAAAQAAQLQTALATLSARLDLPAPEVRTVTKADVALAAEASEEKADDRFRPPLQLLAGTPPPLPWLGRVARPAHIHADRDDETLARAAAIADLVRRTPELVERARNMVVARRSSAAPRVQSALDEWRVLLETQTPARLAALLLRRDARMTRLRQTLPFLEALTREERAEVDAAVALRNAALRARP
jgi:predicted transcriptional regulator